MRTGPAGLRRSIISEHFLRQIEHAERTRFETRAFCKYQGRRKCRTIWWIFDILGRWLIAAH
jgi:hypothetical protein